MTNVPTQYQSLMADAARQTGMPESVVVAQVNEESGFNPNAVSPANAQGMFQFLPSTYTGLGFPAGTEFNPTEEEKAYVAYMKQLLSQEGGSVFKALEAYNAGPGNLGAGAGYANTILSAAGTGVNIKAGGGSTGGGGTPATTTGFNPLNPASYLSPVIQSAAGAIGSSFLSQFGIKDAKDFFVRFGFILLGAILIIVGIMKMFSAGKAAEAGGAALTLIPGAEGAGLGMMRAGTQVQRRGVAGAAKSKARARAKSIETERSKSSGPAETGAGKATNELESNSKRVLREAP